MRFHVASGQNDGCDSDEHKREDLLKANERDTDMIVITQAFQQRLDRSKEKQEEQGSIAVTGTLFEADQQNDEENDCCCGFQEIGGQIGNAVIPFDCKEGIRHPIGFQLAADAEIRDPVLTDPFKRDKGEESGKRDIRDGGKGLFGEKGGKEGCQGYACQRAKHGESAAIQPEPGMERDAGTQRTVKQTVEHSGKDNAQHEAQQAGQAPGALDQLGVMLRKEQDQQETKGTQRAKQAPEIDIFAEKGDNRSFFPHGDHILKSVCIWRVGYSEIAVAK